MKNVKTIIILSLSFILSGHALADEERATFGESSSNSYYNQKTSFIVDGKEENPLVGEMIFDAKAADGHAACIFISKERGGAMIDGINGESAEAYMWMKGQRRVRRAPRGNIERAQNPCFVVVALREALRGNNFSRELSNVKQSGSTVSADVRSGSQKLIVTYANGIDRLPTKIVLNDVRRGTSNVQTIKINNASKSMTRVFGHGKSSSDKKFEKDLKKLNSKHKLDFVEVAIRRLSKQY